MNEIIMNELLIHTTYKLQCNASGSIHKNNVYKKVFNVYNLASEDIDELQKHVINNNKFIGAFGSELEL